MSFIDEYEALTAGNDDELLDKQLHLLAETFTRDPQGLFTELRTRRPLLVSPGKGPVIVTRFHDVVEVLDLDGIFSVKPYERWIRFTGHGPNYILGMDDSPQLQADQSILRLAARRDDLDAVRRIVDAAAEAYLGAVRHTKRLDLADSFAREVPLKLAAEYFGVPGPDPRTLGRWTRTLFLAIFGNFTADPKIAEAGKAAGGEFIAYLDGLIADLKARRRSGEPPRDDVVGRLISMQCAPNAAFDDARIRDNLIGTINGIIDNTNTAVNRAVDAFLDRPDAMAAAAAAARAGDDDVLFAHILEVMRFNPPAPILARVSVREHVLARGTSRAATVPAGRLVLLATGGAMMDETELDAPSEYRPGRPYHQYLHFGRGIHMCFGRFISRVQLVALIGRLLLLPNLRRASGDEGKLTFRGPFPERFVLNFDA